MIGGNGGRTQGRRRFLGLVALAAGVGVSGCSGIGNGSTNDPRTAEFAFEYAPTEGSLTVRHADGDAVPVGQLEIRSSAGTTVRWAQLGTTSEVAGETVDSGSTATLNEGTINWPAEVEPTETIRVVFVTTAGNPVTLDRYTPAETTGTAATGPEEATGTGVGTSRSTGTATASPRAGTVSTAETEEVVFFEGFEDERTKPWDAQHERWGRSQEYAFEGDYSGGIDASGDITTVAEATPSAVAGGQRPDRFEFRWLESDSSYGGGVRLLNSNGTVEIGVGTTNPQWIVDGANGVTQVADGVSYEQWVETAVAFDWEAGTATVTFEAVDGPASYSARHELKQGTDIEGIQLRGYESRLGGWETNSCVMYWDAIRLLG
jgi:hypothetical protein